MPIWLETYLIVGIISGILNSIWIMYRYDLYDDGNGKSLMGFILVFFLGATWPVSVPFGLYLLIKYLMDRKPKYSDKKKFKQNQYDLLKRYFGEEGIAEKEFMIFKNDRKMKNLLNVIEKIKGCKEGKEDENMIAIRSLEVYAKGIGETGWWYIKLPREESAKSKRKSTSMKFVKASNLALFVILNESSGNEYKIIDNRTKKKAIFK